MNLDFMLQPSTVTFIGGFQWRGFNDPMNFIGNLPSKTTITTWVNFAPSNTGRVVSTKSDFCWSKNCPENIHFFMAKGGELSKGIYFHSTCQVSQNLNYLKKNGQLYKDVISLLPKNKRSSLFYLHLLEDIPTIFPPQSSLDPNSEIPNQLTCPGHLWMDGIPAW